MTLLSQRHYGSFSAVTGDETPEVEIPSEEQWSGIYQMGNKIGYSMRKIQRDEDGYKVEELTFMRLKVMSAQKEIKTEISAILNKALLLRSFIFKLQSDINLEVTGKIEGKTLNITLKGGGINSQQKITLKELPYISPALPQILKKGINQEGRIRLPMIELLTLTSADMELEVMGREPLIVMGIKRDVSKLKGSFKGTEFFIWMTDEGEILKEESIGFISIKETKESALNIEKPFVDLISYLAIPFEMSLPEDVSFLKVRLKGIKLNEFELSGGNQKLTGDVLEIQSQTIHEGHQDIPENMDEYLKDTPFVQSNDPLIISLAKEIIGNEKDNLKKARLIYEWVYRNIKKVPALTLPSAIEVLKSRRGDCNEHTTLYTALSRAVGIPTRIVVGLVYRKGAIGGDTSAYFYYHAWPEVYLGKWITIDPTLGEFPADATHIRLLTGDIDKQFHLISVIGKLKIEGIEYR